MELDLVELLQAIPKSSEADRRALLEQHLFTGAKNVLLYWEKMVEFTKYLEDKKFDKDVRHFPFA